MTIRPVLALLAFAGCLVTAAPVGASDLPPFEARQHVKQLHVASIAVSDQSCQHIAVQVTVTDGVGFVETGFHRGGVEVANLTMDTPDGVGYDHLQWCPDADLGHYRAGPTQLCSTDAFGYEECYKKDLTTTDFYVRRFSRTQVVSHVGSTVVAKVTAYSLSQRRYAAVSGVVVELISSGHVVDKAKTSGGTATLHGSGGRVVAIPTATVAGSHHAAAPQYRAAGCGIGRHGERHDRIGSTSELGSARAGTARSDSRRRGLRRP